MTDGRVIRTLLGEAYEDDPLSAWMFREPRTRQDCCAAWYGLFVESYLDAGQISEVFADGRLVAVCLWRAPDDPPMEFTGKPTVAGLLAALVGVERATVIGDALHGIHDITPDERVAYVNFLAVRPELSGQGLGMRALAPVLAAGHPVRLETTNPRNLTFYERAGFTVTGQLQLGDGPLLRSMLRQPA